MIAAAALAAAACGGDNGRAAAVSASTSGTVVTGNQTDLGSIIIGWGDKHADTAITTPKPEDVDARCVGRGDNLAVDIRAPHGWIITARNPSQRLTVQNTEQKLKGDIDTTNRYLEALKAVDWSEADQLDIAVTADAPKDWKSPTSVGRIYIAIHVDCR
ncbi:hypothetical protein [Nocardia pseudovaccinii]|uniref:hypothetical protein n=1 Tax=Nocardia pseudovaccinii TaxID=189540 RepID=UPI001FE0EE9F|nr:hypothetical protein [Nocardia pseudovaccinii]